MAKPFVPQIATGNALLEGDVVYFADDGSWTRTIRNAATALTAEAAQDLLARASRFSHEIVGIYLVDTRLDEDGRAAPAHFREAFRMRGPSNYFHGKQAEDLSDV